jgi:hypothetical protein
MRHMKPGQSTLGGCDEPYLCNCQIQAPAKGEINRVGGWGGCDQGLCLYG